MPVIRFLAALLIIGIGTSAALYLVTGNRKWLRLGWKILALGLVIVLILLALFALERAAIAI